MRGDRPASLHTTIRIKLFHQAVVRGQKVDFSVRAETEIMGQDAEGHLSKKFPQGSENLHLTIHQVQHVDVPLRVQTQALGSYSLGLRDEAELARLAAPGGSENLLRDVGFSGVCGSGQEHNKAQREDACQG